MVGPARFNKIIELYVEAKGMEQVLHDQTIEHGAVLETNGQLARTQKGVEEALKLLKQDTHALNMRVTELVKEQRPREELDLLADEKCLLSLQEACCTNNTRAIRTISAYYNDNHRAEFQIYHEAMIRASEAYKKCFDEVQEAHQDVRKEDIGEEIFNYLYSSNFILGLNRRLGTNFDYNIRHRDLNTKIQKVVNHRFWDNLGQKQGCHKSIRDIRAVLIKNGITEEERFNRINLIAGQALKGWGSIHSDVKKMLQAIVGKEMIDLEAVFQKAELMLEGKREIPKLYTSSVSQTVEAQLVSKPITTQQQQYNRLVNLFVEWFSNDIYANQLLDEVKPLLSELLSVSEEVEKAKGLLKAYEENFGKEAKRKLEKQIKKYEDDPTISAKLAEEKDKFEIGESMSKANHSMQNQIIQEALMLKNRLIAQSKGVLMQAIAAQKGVKVANQVLVEDTHRVAIGSGCKHPSWESCEAFYEIYSYFDGTTTGYTTTVERINFYSGTDDLTFTITYREMNQRIGKALQLSLWDRLSDSDGVSEPIKRLKAILANRSGVSEEKLFMRLQQFCSDCLAKEENPLFFWTDDLDLEVMNFMKAVVKQDVVGLELLKRKSELFVKPEKFVEGIRLTSKNTKIHFTL